MPRHIHYVEPYAGGLAVLLARDPEDRRLWVGDDGSCRGVSEVANDVNGRLMNFWRVLRSHEHFPEFLRQVQAVPLSRAEWEAAHSHIYGDDPVADAVAFFVNCRQSLAGRMQDFTGITRTRTRRGINGNASEWLSAVDGLPDVHRRLRRVVVENRPALDVIRREDGRGTLFYLDPPYLHETRADADAYASFEMTTEDHRELLEMLAGIEGQFILSGYRSVLYDTAAVQHGWRRLEFEIANHAAGGESKRRMTECVWVNYDPVPILVR
jgi:DNA adenine methylase